MPGAHTRRGERTPKSKACYTDIVESNRFAGLPLLELIPALSPDLRPPHHLKEWCALIERAATEPIRALCAIPIRHFKTTTTLHGIVWLPMYGCSLKFGVDGISMTLLLLVGFVSFCGAFISSEIHEREKEYYILFLALTSGISGTFATSMLLSASAMSMIQYCPMSFHFWVML